MTRLFSNYINIRSYREMIILFFVFIFARNNIVLKWPYWQEKSKNILLYVICYGIAGTQNVWNVFPNGFCNRTEPILEYYEV